MRRSRASLARPVPDRSPEGAVAGEQARAHCGRPDPASRPGTWLP